MPGVPAPPLYTHGCRHRPTERRKRRPNRNMSGWEDEPGPRESAQMAGPRRDSREWWRPSKRRIRGHVIDRRPTLTRTL
jgi:hypothetical protein